MDLIAPERLEELLSSVEQVTQEHLDQLIERRTELRDRYGPPELASEGAGVGHQLILDFDVQMAQLKLAFIDRVRSVANIRSVVEATRSSEARKRRASW
jgi:hypothetical protein